MVKGYLASVNFLNPFLCLVLVTNAELLNSIIREHNVEKCNDALPRGAFVAVAQLGDKYVVFTYYKDRDKAESIDVLFTTGDRDFALKFVEAYHDCCCDECIRNYVGSYLKILACCGEDNCRRALQEYERELQLKRSKIEECINEYI